MGSPASATTPLSLSPGRASMDGLPDFRHTRSGQPVQPMKYILITGGVVSGLGKGVTASSVGVCLKILGFRCSYRVGRSGGLTKKQGPSCCSTASATCATAA